MSDHTKIQWTDATWNPVTGCTQVSPGCDHCYALTLAERFRGTPGHYFEQGFDVVLRPDKLAQPLHWKKPRLVFVNSMSDLFHEEIPDEYIARVWAVMAMSRRHTFQVLTKRHGRLRSLLSSERFKVWTWAAQAELLGTCTPDDTWPLPNVWLGVSVEDQKWANIRIPALLETPAATRFISAEPLLGPVDLHGPIDESGQHRPRLKYWLTGRPGFNLDGYHSIGPKLDWVIVGGESGRGARPMHAEWARTLRDQCVETGTAFHFKQWGTHGGISKSAREIDGRTWDEFPGGDR